MMICRMSYTILMNTLNFLKEVYVMLKKAGIEVWVFGGWAEELQGIIAPRVHKDIDLLYVGDDFSKVNTFIREDNLNIVKNFPHKRAFMYNEIMIEVFLVTNETTNFFSLYVHDWPSDTFKHEAIEGMRVCSIDSLNDYRQKHSLVEEASTQSLM